jgi:BppU N-terminal domain
MHVDLVAGDSGSKLVVTCKDKDSKAAINLTGATVRVKFRVNDGSLITQVMAISNPTGGVAEYLFLSSELPAGTIKGEVEITDSNNRVLTQVEPFSLYVRPKV